MRLLLAFAIAFITALAGMFLAIFAGDYLTRLYRVSDFEGQQGASEFIQLNLPRTPRKEDETWSDWILATQRADLTPVSDAERIAVRYRVREIE